MKTCAFRKMATGDVIAFADSSWVSQLIRRATQSDVTHAAVIYGTAGGTQLVEVVRLGWLSGTLGLARLSNGIMEYDTSGGRVWWLPLAHDTRQRMNEGVLLGAIDCRLGRKCGAWDTIEASLLSFVWPDPRRIYYPEMLALAFRAAAVLPATVNVYGVTPQDVISWPIYADCVQICGTPLRPRGFAGTKADLAGPGDGE